ncbi:penicillin-binding transpeptidase domain-containing protein [Fluviicola sp.]|jgi:penicillin-binding protein 2|uniref:penicillin-binding transpeptidase domain-containing protein n=1 Tax=Fluviicola sp. TaxID=1917219 RepID=UPI002836C0B7|nr:penicillin-binding transpeptidase domain-containing protein [Fluviicola sp.]MDR0801920.1 penicillin-binding protein 2 [Fluviicola sp.]
MNLGGRKYVILVFFTLVGSIYLIRLFFMQVVDDSWKLRAQEIAEKRKEITPPRGIVFDRNGKKVVTNRSYYNLMMKEEDIHDFDTVAFAKLVGWTKQEVKDRFYQIRKGEGKYRNKNTGKVQENYQKQRAYPFIKELTIDEITRIAPHLEKFPGFFEDLTSMRNYPYAGGANIFGYLNEVSKEEIEEDRFYRPGDQIGRAGIERYYEKQLRGRKGIKYIVTSALNNAIESYADGKYDTLAQQGPALHLGLDIQLQVYGEKLMQNKRGCIVAIEPKTGEILSLVSAPSFDPNILVGRRNIGMNYPKLLLDEGKPLYPRPLAAEYPPGSVFKLLQSLIGLQEGVITPESGFPCTKSMVGCHNHPNATNLPDGIKYSCNPYFYYVMRRIIQQGKKRSIFADAELGLNEWYDYIMSFGLGSQFETDVTGMRPGLIPNSAYYDKWYGHNTWAFSTIRSISIGQGEVKVTPLQMANIVAIIANRGWYYTPHFVRSIGNDGPLPQFKVVHKTKIEPVHYDPIIEGMRRVCYEAGGTGKRAVVEGITVCGKTGTAQNPHGEDHSVFIAFAPMENPKIAIAVFIENAGFGGVWAAPTASLMIEKYLNRKVKDKAKEQMIVSANLLNIKAKPKKKK